MKKINIGMIGYRFMGKAHSFGIEAAPFFFKNGIQPVKKVICGRSEHLVKQAAQEFGWEEYSTDWEEVINRDDIDLIDIATPTNLHKDIAIAAIKAGKHVFCEKPLSLNATDAKEMLEAAEKSGVMHMLGHNYRRVPAIALAKKMIAEGKLGEIYHFRGVYLQDWIMDPNFPLTWQLDKKIAGAGPHADLNSHVVDLARYLVGELDKVIGMEETFIKRRPKAAVEEKLNSMLTNEGKVATEYGDVTVDDTTAFLAKFKDGAVGTFEASRFAGGRKNHERIEINGSKGSISFNFERMNELEYWSKEDDLEVQGFRTILVTEGCHPYISAWWPAGHVIGYENTFVNEFADLFKCISESTKPQPNFYDGWKNAQVLDAVAKSIKTLTWENVD
ncbi:MAG TPA: Gfo/Idh/MocA family oxidoreductase [Ruminiclostridium sp.]